MYLPCRRAGVAAVLLAAALLATPATAVADDGGHLLVDVPNDGAGFVSDTATPLIHALRLAPGSVVSGDLALKNDSGVTAHLVLQSVDVHDDDNGCNLPETRDGDTTCGRDGGELGRWLVVTVSRDVGGAMREVWHGNLADLASGVDMHADVAPGATWPVRVRVALPYAATNETQSDRISFAMRWSAVADLGGGTAPAPAQVLGVEAFAPGSGADGTVIGGGAGVPLPFTGARVGLPLLLADAGLLVLGVALLRTSRRRRFTVAGTPARRR